MVALLVLVLLLAGLPVVAMGMSHGDSCPLCTGPEGPFAVALCAAVLATGVILLPLARRRRYDAAPLLMHLRLLTTGLERPPQVA